MALQVWLPLNGDLTQQGLSGVEITNSGATVNNEGKIGKCYQFGTAASYMTIPAESMKTCTEASVSFWVKILSWNTSYATLFQAGTNGYSWQNYIFGVLRNSTNSTLCFTIGNGSTTSTTTCQTSALELNTWYHLTFTYNSNGDYSIYINGILNKKSHTDSIIPAFSQITMITLGRANGNGYQSNCLINDVRIYDHCLSVKEVKELSKGLVLHYKLDKIKQTLINAYTYPTFNTSTATAGWNHWGRTDAVGTNGQNQDKQYIFRPNQQYSHWVANASTATMSTGGYLFYQSPAFAGGYRSIQCIVKEENSLPITEEIVMPAWNARNGGAEQNIWTSVESLGNGFYLCKCEGVSQDGSNDLIGFYIGPGYKVYFSEAYCEDNKEKCTDIFSLEDFELDSSGYKNEGTLISAPTFSTDSARYSKSISFDGTDDGILIENLQLSNIINSEITYSFWIKPNGEAGARSVYFGSYNGTSWSIEKSTGNLLRLYWNGSPDETTTGVTIADNIWQHICITKKGTSDVKVYINGIQKWTSTVGHNALTFPTTYRIGRDTRSGDGTPYKGLMSDFRIYATALSAEDIAELYHTAASVDNHSNVYAGEIKEV